MKRIILIVCILCLCNVFEANAKKHWHKYDHRKRENRLAQAFDQRAASIKNKGFSNSMRGPRKDVLDYIFKNR